MNDRKKEKMISEINKKIKINLCLKENEDTYLIPNTFQFRNENMRI